jgi:hypothetical protein
MVRDQEVEGSNPFAPTNSFETNNLHYTKMSMDLLVAGQEV